MLPCTDTDPDQHYYSQLHDLQKLCDSKYYNIDEFNRATIRNLNYKKFSMYHCNIRSATNNGNNLSIHMKALNHEFDVIALTETWLNDLNSDIVGFPNYNHVFKCRQSKMSILVKNDIRYHELIKFNIINDIIESVFIEIEMTGTNHIIGCIYMYRAPNSNLSMFNEEINNIMMELNKLNKPVYL